MFTTVSIMSIVGGLFAIASAVLLIWGSLKSKKECSRFVYVIPFVILSLVCGVTVYVYREMVAFQSFAIMGIDMLDMVFGSVAVIVLSSAIAQIYKKKNKPKRAKQGIVISVLFTIFLVIAKLLEQITCIAYGHVWDNETGILLVMAWLPVLLITVSYVMLLIYLQKAKKEIK